MLFGEPYALMNHARLHEYSENLVALGYDSAAHLLELDPEETETCIKDLAMKPGHAVRFRKLLANGRRLNLANTHGVLR